MPRRICPLVLLALALWPAAAHAGFAPLPDKQLYLLQNPAEGKVSDEPLTVASGDVTGDGKIDLVVPATEADDGSGKLHIFQGDGSGRFSQGTGSPFQTARRATGIAVGDWTADAIPDVITSSEILPQTALADGLVVLHPGAGGGSYGTPQGHPTSGDWTVGLATGQFTGSDLTDLAVADRFDSLGAAPARVSVLRRTGAWSFAAPDVYPLGPGVDPRSLTSGDFNGDGRLDLATANDSGSVSVLLQQADGSFAAAPAVASGTTDLRSIVAAHLDGDGALDLAVAARTSPGGVAVLRGNGAGGFAAVPGSPFATGANNARTVVAADLDGDADVDLAATNNQNPGSVAVLNGDGAGGFAHAAGSPFPTAIVELPSGLTVNDFDGDAQPDLATVHSENAARMVVQLNDLQPSARLGPGPLKFGKRGVKGKAKKLQATLTNDGPGFVLSRAEVSGKGFDIADEDCFLNKLVAGASCTVDVRFKPTKLGSHSGSLRVTVAGATEPLTLALTGRGRRPQLSRVRVRGRTVRFRVAERGRAKLTIQRRAGRRWKPTRMVLRRTARAGTNRIRFKRQRLNPGAHRVRVVVRDPAGFASKPRTARFRVVQR